MAKVSLYLCNHLIRVGRIKALRDSHPATSSKGYDVSSHVWLHVKVGELCTSSRLQVLEAVPTNTARGKLMHAILHGRVLTCEIFANLARALGI